MKQNIITIIGAAIIAIMLFIPLPKVCIFILFGFDVFALLICGIATLIKRIKGNQLFWLPRFILIWCICTVSIVIATVRILLTSENPDFPALIFSKDTSNKNLFISILIFLILTTITFIHIGTGKKRLKEEWEKVKERGIKEEIEFFGSLDSSFKFLSGTFNFMLFITIVIFFGRTLIDNSKFNIAMNVASRKNIILAMEISIIVQALISICSFMSSGCIAVSEENKEA